MYLLENVKIHKIEIAFNLYKNNLEDEEEIERDFGDDRIFILAI